MTDRTIPWPQKTREMHNHHFDSTVWNGFRFRDDDIIIATYAKSGTTWTQQIVSQLIFDGAEGLNVSEMSPWVDLRVPAKPEKLRALESQAHRRFLKTHLPVDALVFSPKAKYIFIARDGRDVVWSMYNHHANANDTFYEVLNNTPGRVGPPIERPPASVRQYFLDWLERDGHPFWPFWENIKSWWDIRHLPNVLTVHFEELKRDLPGQISRIAAFLDIPLKPESFGRIVHHCSFDYMKANAALCAPLGGLVWEGGADTFINKGTNGRWRDVLTQADNERYEAMAIQELGPECAHWLRTGEMPGRGRSALAA
jgi:aryl sulfotransferase